MWSCLPNQPNQVTNILVFDPPESRDRSGSLLEFPAPRLPLVCRAKESAVLGLLPVSACSVVVGPGAGFVGPGGPDEVFFPPPPQAVSDHAKHAPARETTTHFSVEGRRIDII